MTQFAKLGVFLDGFPGSDEALAFAGVLANRIGADKLLCVHVHGRAGQIAGTDPPQREFESSCRERLPAAVADKSVFEVHEGSGIPEILRCARDQSLDLVVVGRRLPSDDLAAGSAFTRLARKCPCSVLVVPSYAHVHLERFLVPVDGSDNARRALEVALELARLGSGQVVAQQVYTVGYGYQYTGADIHDANKKLEQVTREQLDRFVAEVDVTGVRFETVLTCSEHSARAINELAVAMKMDVIVIGSHGMSATAVALLGSTTERVLMVSPLPVLVVKRKGETVRLLAALLGD